MGDSRKPSDATVGRHTARFPDRRSLEGQIISLSERFMLAGDAVDAAIADALSECATFAGADMGYVLRVDDNGRTFSMTDLWRGEPIPPSAITVRNVPVEFLPEETRALLLLRVEDVDTLPAELPFKASLLAHGVRALLDVPIRYGDALLGSLGLSMTKARHPWTEDEAVLLQVFAGAIGPALERARAIRRREELETQLKQAQRMEVAARMASGIAHDFRNMLSVVLTCSELAADGATPPVDREVLLREVRDAATRAATLATRLMQVGKDNAEDLQHLDVAALLGALTPTLRRLLGGRGELAVTVPDGVPLYVRGDAADLEQALTNLCLNARDALGNSGRVTVEATLERVEAEGLVNGLPTRPGLHVVLTVSDTGVGIDPDHVARIFEPYFTTKEPGQGTGLGLATVYATCKRHGGWVAVDTSLGEGSRFRLYLPASDEPRSRRGLEAPADDGESPLPCAEAS